PQQRVPRWGEPVPEQRDEHVLLLSAVRRPCPCAAARAPPRAPPPRSRNRARRPGRRAPHLDAGRAYGDDVPHDPQAGSRAARPQRHRTDRAGPLPRHRGVRPCARRAVRRVNECERAMKRLLAAWVLLLATGSASWAQVPPDAEWLT